MAKEVQSLIPHPLASEKRDPNAAPRAEVRRSIASLQGKSEVPTALSSRLQKMLRELPTDSEGPAVELAIQDAASLRLPPDQAEQVVRVVQEAVVNARRHARARRIQVRLERSGQEARVIVEDDGCGFDPEGAARREGHFGLRIMHARAGYLGGRLTIESAPGQGTRVILTWPLVDPQPTGAG